MRRGVAAPAIAVAIGALAAGGCGDDSGPEAAATTTAPAALPTAAQVRGALLTVDDLGAGWTTQSVPRDGEPLCGVATTAPDSPVRGRAGFRKGTSGPFVVQRFVGFPPRGAEATMAALKAAVEDCRETVSESGGTRVAWRVTQLPAGAVGDESVAVRLTTDDAGQGRAATVDEVIFRRGEFVGGIAAITLGAPDASLTTRAVRAADRKLFMLAGG